MNLNNENTRALLENRFSIDFISITLTQKGCEDPIVYSGSGTIAQSEDGLLHLKLYHSFVDLNKELFGETGEKAPGKIMGDEHYFSLLATDMKGQEWTAEKVYVSGGFSIPAAGKVITSKINELNKIEVREKGSDKNKSNLLMLVKGKFDVPANEIEDRDGYRHLNTFKMENETLSIELKNRDDHLLIRMTSQNELFKEETSDILLEALSIVFGKIVTPVCRFVAHDEIIITSLISTPIKFPNTNMSEPIPYKFPHHGSPLWVFRRSRSMFRDDGDRRSGVKPTDEPLMATDWL